METLLRPAKQLAEWNSCFAQDLEKYFTLLKESQNVCFGEAALVLQNSANVYARRVEYLWDETEALNQSLRVQNEDKSTEESTAKDKRTRKSKGAIDFNDFESLKLEDLVGKSTNLKPGGQKSLKLLTRRFTQLESNLAQLSTPIEILSAHGEVIGNKYDFRCNQQLTKNCMLVDELIPNDFEAAPIAATPDPGTTAIPIQIQDTSFDSMFEPHQSAASPESIVSEEMETENVNICVNNNLEETSNIPDETDAGYTSGDAAEDATEQPLTSNCAPAEQSTGTETQPTATKAQTSATKTQPTGTEAQTSATETQPTATEAQTSETETETNATEAQLTPTTDSIDNQALEPIPFEEGVPDTIPRRRTTFKLPCHISLLKTKAESRKRKNISESKKREYLTRFLLDKYNLVHKKFKMYSPTRQLFTPLKKEELEEFQRTFDQYLKSMQGSESYHYDAVTNGVTMELLGFQPNFTKHDLLTDNHTYIAENPITGSRIIDEPESDLSSVPESFTTPPPTPEVANHRLNYKELVEQRMKQIGDESREQSDLEQRVAEWHRSLRPKLTAAGRRPPFHIHDYGSRIIETLKVAEGKELPFKHLVQHESAPEVARYFLASLQLANSYNVAINTSGDSGCGIELKLLDKEVNHEPLGLHEKIDRLPLSEVSIDRTVLRISTT